MKLARDQSPSLGETKARKPFTCLEFTSKGKIFIKLTVLGKRQKHRISQTDTGRKNHSSIQKQHTEGASESKGMQRGHWGAAGRHRAAPHVAAESVQQGSNCLPTKDTKNQVKDEK